MPSRRFAWSDACAASIRARAPRGCAAPPARLASPRVPGLGRALASSAPPPAEQKVSATSTKKADSIGHEIKVNMSPASGVAVEGKVDASGKIGFKVDYTDIKNVKVTANVAVPDVLASDVDLVVTTGGSTATETTIGLSSTPKVHFVASNSGFVSGMTSAAELSFDMAKGGLSKYGFATSYKQGDMTAVAQATDKLDTVKVGLVHNYSDAFSWAAEYAKKLSKDSSTFTVGQSFKIDPSSSIKAKLDNNGVLSAVYKLEVKKGTSFAATAEMSALNLEKAPKLGFTVSMK